MQLSNIDLNLLVVLDALLESRSVKLAAPRLSLSPSATSHALGRLRELIGDPLLVRAGRQLVLTPRAEALKTRLRRLLEETDALLNLEDTFDAQTMQRRFAIASTDYAEMIVVRSLSDQLNKVAPLVDLSSRALAADVTERLRAGDYELALGVFADQPADIHREAILDERFVCLLRRGHGALKKQFSLDVYAALSHVLVAPRGQPRGVVDVRLEKEGLSRRIARTVSSFYAAPFLVANSDLVVTLPERVARRVAPDLDLVVRQPPLPLPGFALTMAWHRRLEDDAGHRWLRERVTQAASGRG